MRQRIPLTGGAYKARSVIASAQRCVNLIPEAIPPQQGEPAGFIHYPTPGLRLLAKPTTPGPGRGLYRGTDDNLYAVVGQTFYWISSLSADGFRPMGTLTRAGTGPVSMKDNNLILFVVDGSDQGWTYDMAQHSFATMADPAFYGANRVDFIDTFFTFNKPQTGLFYVSPSEFANTGTFDANYFAGKETNPDLLQTQIVLGQQIYLVGRLTSEVWYDTGASDFPFGRVPGASVDHGTVAPYSVAKSDKSVFWLGQDEQGQGVVWKVVGYAPTIISTPAIAAEFQTYAILTDAVAYTYQLGGHFLYVLNFPAADKTWVFDDATQLWHEWVSLDAAGVEHRHRVQFAAFAFGQNVGLDWETGALYALDPATYTDNGQAIVWRRGFPHMMNNGGRVSYAQFLADVDVSAAAALAVPPTINLRWSDTRGATWGTPVAQPLAGAQGALTSVQWRRLGLARDRVFELYGTLACQTAIAGAFVDTVQSAS